LATISVPYVPGADKVTKIEGRTIHPDGTVIPLTVKPDDLLAWFSPCPASRSAVSWNTAFATAGTPSPPHGGFSSRISFTRRTTPSIPTYQASWAACCIRLGSVPVK
jgi:hypothetical protein